MEKQQGREWDSEKNEADFTPAPARTEKPLRTLAEFEADERQAASGAVPDDQWISRRSSPEQPRRGPASDHTTPIRDCASGTTRLFADAAQLACMTTVSAAGHRRARSIEVAAGKALTHRLRTPLLSWRPRGARPRRRHQRPARTRAGTIRRLALPRPPTRAGQPTTHRRLGRTTAGTRTRSRRESPRSVRRAPRPDGSRRVLA